MHLTERKTMIRNDFVSNSSSSSFIIISTKGKDCTEEIVENFKRYDPFDWNKEKCRFPNKDFKHQFGWEYENTRDFYGKLNFVAIQLLYVLQNDFPYLGKWNPICNPDFVKYYNMVKNVCNQKFGFDFRLRTECFRFEIFRYEDGKYHKSYSIDSEYYIDHQSSYQEGECMEMFESEETLYNFLRFDESYIEGGNDNTAPEDMNDY